MFLHVKRHIVEDLTTLYEMTMLALVSCMKILIEWKYTVYPDSILNRNGNADDDED
jgi:hypothetical protein